MCYPSAPSLCSVSYLKFDAESGVCLILVCLFAGVRGFKDGLADYLHLFIIDGILPKSFSWGFFVLVLLVSRFPLILC